MDDDVTRNQRMLATIALLIGGAVPDGLTGDGVARWRNSLKSNLINRVDVERIERGYYERLVNPGQQLDGLSDLRAVRLRRDRDTTWSVPFDAAPLVMRVDDLREAALKRNDRTEKCSVGWSTNSQGMRDQAYASEKPPDAFRIALVGDSIGAGWGVNVEERFESILEQAWNIRSRDASSWSVEILNFAVPGQSPGQRWYHFSQTGWPMHPDLVICEATAADIGWDERRLRYLLARGLAWNSAVFRQALLFAGVEPHWDPDQYRHVLRARHAEILAGVYQTMAADCRARDVAILWVLIPRVGRRSDASNQRTLLATARAAGFNGVIDISDAYDGADPADLALAATDFHPNPAGHARLARRLDKALSNRIEFKHLWEPTLRRGARRGSNLGRRCSRRIPLSSVAAPGPSAS
jgi:lysophospholipase L1-like esterase